jgi:hypothetical protein
MTPGSEYQNHSGMSPLITRILSAIADTSFERGPACQVVSGPRGQSPSLPDWPFGRNILARDLFLAAANVSDVAINAIVVSHAAKTIISPGDKGSNPKSLRASLNNIRIPGADAAAPIAIQKLGRLFVLILRRYNIHVIAHATPTSVTTHNKKRAFVKINIVKVTNLFIIFFLA